MKKPKKQGFALLSAERRKELAREGGKKAHANGTAHKWTTEEARRAGALGGAVTNAKKKEAAG